MEHTRHELGSEKAGTAAAPTGKASRGGERAQTIKLAIAVAVLVVAGGLIAFQTGLFDGRPEPLAASPEAQADDNVNLDNPGQPPPKSSFSRKPQKVTP